MLPAGAHIYRIGTIHPRATKYMLFLSNNSTFGPCGSFCQRAVRWRAPQMSATAVLVLLAAVLARSAIGPAGSRMPSHTVSRLHVERHASSQNSLPKVTSTDEPPPTEIRGSTLCFLNAGRLSIN